MNKTDFEIRKETLRTNVAQAFSVLYLSDFHFNKKSQKVAEWMVEKTQELQPDIILLGGDYVDTKRGLVHFEYFINSLISHKNVFAIAGNHDYFFGIKKIKKALTNTTVIWIEKDSVTAQIGDIKVQIDGNCLQKANINSDFSILCAHNPTLFNNNISPYQLAFAGHLHGSQFVFWKTKKGLYPGRFFYKWNVLKQTKNDCTCLISKGLGDTLPFRYNCKKDMLFVEIKPCP